MPVIHPHERFNHREASLTFTIADVREAARKFFPAKDPDSVTLLSGGFSNANFLVDLGASRYLLRFFSGGQEVAERESHVLSLASQGTVVVPRVLDRGMVGDHAVAVHEFVPGTLLSQVLEARPGNLRNTFSHLGAELARIHAISFQKAGIFTAKGEIREIPDAGLKFIREFLGGQAGARLGPEMTTRLLAVVDANWHVVNETFQGPVLVHCDFNPKNILVSLPGTGSVSAILDWEYAMSGHALIDLGNFLRFSGDYTAEETTAFLGAYEKAGGRLPKGWQKASRLSDLVSMCAFLASSEEYPKSFRTAKLVIEETVRDLEE